MATPHLVYVHGAGQQENRHILKRRLDEHLFGGNQLDGTTLAYYSDLLHDEPTMPDAIAAAGPEAADIQAAFLARAGTVAAVEAQAVAGGAGGAQPGEGGEGAQPGNQPAAIAGIGFPDPAFLILATLASSDVTSYLFGAVGADIRERVRTAVLAHQPCIVLAHSLGTIVAYDVLSELPGGTVPVFITAGSPLGLANVQRRIGDRSGPPAPLPASVKAWRNFADPFDPVAIERTLADEFTPAGAITDTAVENRALLNHDLTGYLDTDAVRAAVRAALEAMGQGGGD
jgi:hypothetical protein